jgi:2'-5' RNA ligase
LNGELKQLVGKLKRTLKDREQEVRWTPPDLWHVTVQFLGDVPVERARLAFQALRLSWSKTLLKIQGLGAFPEERAARVLWLGVQENQAFLDLQTEVSNQFLQAGFPVDEKDFRPHLTLARLRNAVSVSDLVKMGQRKYFGEYLVSELVLFESVLQGNMTKYIPLERRSI